MSLFNVDLSNALDGFKKRFLDSVGQADSQVFTEDLRNMIMSANTDQEIDAIIQALKKYDIPAGRDSCSPTLSSFSLLP